MKSSLTPQNPIIVEGQVIVDKPATLVTSLQRAGVVILIEAKLAKIRLADKDVFLQGLKIIIRASGRKAHLARYLIGICVDTGRLIEIFLEVVTGIKNHLFQLCINLQQQLMKVFAGGLSPFQQIQILLQQT
jgi:hypothetical protein